jgi:hypothetical protein
MTITTTRLTRWTVSCRDVFGRSRTASVLVTSSGIVMNAPPGEVAVLSVEQADELAEVLRRASERQRGNG